MKSAEKQQAPGRWAGPDGVVNQRLKLSTECPEGVHQGQKGVGAVIQCGLNPRHGEKSRIALSRAAPGLHQLWLRPEDLPAKALSGERPKVS